MFNVLLWMGCSQTVDVRQKYFVERDEVVVKLKLVSVWIVIRCYQATDNALVILRSWYDISK